MAPVITPAPYDLKNAISPNRMTGLWRMLTGYRWLYVATIACLAVASLAKTSTYLLLRYYVDSILGKNAALAALAMVGLGFVLIALVEGAFTFLSVRLASRSAEGITLRLRTFLFDHIQRLSFSYHDKTQTGDLIQRSTSDVDAIRRFYADQAIGIGRIVLLFTHQLLGDLAARPGPGADLGGRHPDHRRHVALLLQASVEGVREVSGARGHPLHRASGKPIRRARGQSLCPAGVRAREVREGELGEVPAGQAAADDARALLAHVRHPVRPANAARLHGRRTDGDQRDDHRGHVHGLCRPARLADLPDAQPGPADRADLHRHGLLRPRGRGHQPGARAADRGQPSTRRRCARARSSFAMCRSNIKRTRPCSRI